MTTSTFKPRTKPTKTVKPSKCRVCRKPYAKLRMMQKACGPECAEIIAKRDRERAAAKLARLGRADTAKRKEALKTRAEWIADVQVHFNAFIRARDIAAGHGCIDCGKPFEPSRPGGSVDAGHFLGRGMAPHQRFNENNCFAQRKNCNRPGGTTRDAFRAGVEVRIGLPALEALERDQTVQKWTIDELKRLKAEYKQKLKELQK